MFRKKRSVWIIIFSIVIFIGVSSGIFLIFSDDEITESKGEIEISVDDEPIDMTDMVIISFTENDKVKPITIKNAGKKIYLEMNTWDKSEYVFKFLIDKSLIGKEEAGINELQHIFVYSPANVDMEAMINININYYNKNNIWYANIIYEIRNPKIHAYEETFSLEEGTTFMNLES